MHHVAPWTLPFVVSSIMTLSKPSTHAEIKETENARLLIALKSKHTCNCTCHQMHTTKEQSLMGAAALTVAWTLNAEHPS